jgi:hypothetical protein
LQALRDLLLDLMRVATGLLIRVAGASERVIPLLRFTITPFRSTVLKPDKRQINSAVTVTPVYQAGSAPRRRGRTPFDPQ